MGYKLLRDLPGAKAESKVKVIGNADDILRVTHTDELGEMTLRTIAYIPKAELNEWVEDTDKVRRIEPLDLMIQQTSLSCAMKINELVEAVNKLQGV